MAILTLITLLLLLPTIYLLHVRFSKTKLKAIKKKHPIGSPNFETYRVIYSTRTLALLTFLSGSSLVDLLVNLYKSTHAEVPVWASLVVLGATFLPLGLFIWWSVVNRKK